MNKTTIDGLKVRSSNTAKKPSAKFKSAKTTDLSMTKNPARLNSATDPLRQKSEAEEFLGPVEGFSIDNADATLLNDDSSDWSDILTKMQKDDKTSTDEELFSDDDWLEDWGGKKDSNFDLELGLDRDEDDVKYVKKARKHRKRHIGRNIALAVVALLVLGGGALYFWGDGLISRLTGGRSGFWDTLSAIVSDEIPFEEDAMGRTNVLVFGTEGYNMDGDTAYGEHGGSQLTDSIMVVSFDQRSKDVALLSLPRDLKVPMACSAGKINEVFYCHNKSGTDEKAGAEALMQQIGDILGINFQYYAHVNWASLIDIIDTIGGITVTLDEDINDYGWTNAVAKAGVPMEVNGEQALGLARARHGTTGGDFTRGNTQQKIVEGIVDKVVHSGIGVQEALGLMNILGDNLRSNFSADNIKAGVRLVSGFDANSIRQIPLVDYETNTFYVKSANINEISYVIPSAGMNDYSKIKEYVDLMLNNDPVKREDAKFVVHNATGVYGVAGAERDKLLADGFKVMGVADTNSEDCKDNICVYALNENMPATVKAMAERYGVTVRTLAETPEELWSEGVDFVIVVGKVDEAKQA